MKGRKESLTKKVLKYTAVGILGTAIGARGGMMLADKIREGIAPRGYEQEIGSLMHLVIELCYVPICNVYGIILGGSVGVSSSLIGYYGYRWYKERKQK